ncbi:MAG: hypothetical protein K2K90_10395 [Lachnospiraceae bacterium]|nr:hypothetical protein [Lachnospiraceae bacterium]
MRSECASKYMRAGIQTAYILRKKVVRMNEVLKAVLIGIFTTIVAALNKVGEG